MNTNLDAMYYRNRDIIANQGKCSNYKSLRTYTSCTEDQVKSTVVVEEKKTPATAKPAAKPTAAAPVTVSAPVDDVQPTPPAETEAEYRKRFPNYTPVEAPPAAAATPAPAPAAVPESYIGTF